MAYAPQWLPDHSPLRFYVNLAADFIFLSGLFVLGGIFGINCGLCSFTMPGRSSGRRRTFLMRIYLLQWQERGPTLNLEL
jgi:hypothetical protein